MAFAISPDYCTLDNLGYETLKMNLTTTAYCILMQNGEKESTGGSK